jgi:putative photosynthetic complex assembly protein 2
MSWVAAWAPVAYTLLLWWFTTGLILLLDGLGRSSYRWSLGGAALLAGLGLVALHYTAEQATATDAYVAFTSALLIWGFVELAFLTGVLTGPRRTDCPPGARGWTRLRAALGAILHHELALIAAGLAIALVSGVDHIGFWTFAALWLMRQSAKINLYLGVRNTGEQFLPPQLTYIASYFRRRPMNLLFPWSVLALTAAAVLLLFATMAVSQPGNEHTSLTLLTTLVVLGLLEHWFLVLPMDVDALWRWSLRGRQKEPQRVDSLRAMAAPSRSLR